jgi:hypothetical protein
MTATVRVAVNLTWCVSGRVGGSEEYLVRQLLGMAAIGAPYDITVFAPRGFGAAHPKLAALMPIVEARTDSQSRPLRVLVENTWLARRTRSFDLVHHGGGTLPTRGNASTVLTIHDVQFLTYPRVCRGGRGVAPLAELHDRCALANGLAGSPGNRWSAVHMSPGASVSRPHSQQGPGAARTARARLT